MNQAFTSPTTLDNQGDGHPSGRELRTASTRGRWTALLVGFLCAGAIAHAQQTVVANYGGASLTIVDLVTGNRTVLSSGTMGTGALFSQPVGTAREANGNILVGENTGAARIFRVDAATGNRTIVSDATVGAAVGAGPALTQIYGLAVEASGSIVAAVSSLQAIYRINPTTGDRTVVTSPTVGSGATMGGYPFGIILDPDGSIVFSMYWQDADSVIRVNPTTGARSVVSSATVGSGPAFNLPTGIVRMSDGAYAVVNRDGPAYVLRVDPTTGDRTVISGATVGGGNPMGLKYSIALDEGGNLYVGDFTANSIVKIDPATGNRTTISSATVGTGTNFSSPLGMLGAAVTSISGTAPTVTATAATSIAGTSATLGGNVTAAGSATVTATGVVWSVTATNAAPTIGGTGVTVVAIGSGTGAFSQSVTGLPAGTALSFRAYATNGYATGYSSVLTFTTTAGNSAPTDIALSNSSVSQSGGANATVGTLSSTDADSASFTYSLVNGAGSTDNAAFNLAGATLRANDPAVLAAGTYAVRIQTDDGGGGTFAKSFAITAIDNIAPIITSANAAGGTYKTAFAGYTITASGGATSYGATGLPTGLSVDASSGLISGTPTQSGSFPVVLTATDASANTGTGTLTLTIARRSLTVSGLTVADKPYDTTTAATLNLASAALVDVAAGDVVTLNASSATATFADASVGPAKVVTVAGLALAGANASHYALTQPTVTGNISPAAQTITFANPGMIDPGVPFTLRATASSGQPVTFTLISGNASLSGASLTINDLSPVVVRGTQSGGGNYLGATADLTLSATRTDRLMNLSSRARVRPDDNRRLIAGFVIGGAAPKRVLLRAVGPSLAALGVQDVLTNPRLQLFNAKGTMILENDDWSGSDTAATSAQVGAFPLAAGSLDSALVTTLAPGVYTMHITDGDKTGIALAEVYDASTNGQAEYQRLVNISSRGSVEAGDGVLIGGFVIAGNNPKRVLVRGIGPALAGFGVSGVLADPRVAVFSKSTIIAQNDDWGTPQVGTAQVPAAADAIATAAQAVGAFALASGSKDSAVIVSLRPGIYTAHVSAANEQPGVAMVEIYEIP